MRTLMMAALVAVGAVCMTVDANAQTPAAAPAPPPVVAAPARAEDVGSVDAIVAALYRTISGDKGVARDWPRLASLFHPDARFIPTGPDAQGVVHARYRTIDDYIAGSGPFLIANGFHEVEAARRTETYGNIVHVWTTYESRHTLADPKPFARGINSIQLLYDGKRYWILNVAWSSETPQTPIPAEYLPKL
jgi:hypothetical protein